MDFNFESKSLKNKAGLQTSEQTDSNIGLYQSIVNIPVQLYVKNLNYYTTSGSLKQHFEKACPVQSVKIPVSFGRGRGYGFVTVKDKQHAQRAVNMLNDSLLDGRIIHIEIAKNRSIVKASECINLNNQNNNGKILIEQILKPGSVKENDQIEQLKILLQSYKTENDNDLLKTFKNQAFQAIKFKLNDCTTQLEIFLLDILQYIAERGSMMKAVEEKCDDYPKTPLFNEIKRSGLINKIEELLRKIIIIKENNRDILPQSSLFQQLIYIYMLIMYKQNIQIDLLTLCSDSLIYNITTLIDNIKKSENKNQKINDDECKKYQEIDNQIHQTAKFIKAFQGIQQYNNIYYLENSSSKHIRFLILLFHINCPTTINCLHKIIIKPSNQLLQLQFIVNNYFISSIISNEDKQYLINEHNIFLHIFPVIINYSSLIRNKNQHNKYNQHLILLQSNSILTQYLFLLNKLISFDSVNCELVASSENVISSLITLSECNSFLNLHQQYKTIFPKINEYSTLCLNQIFMQGNINALTLLVDCGYAKVLALKFSIAGGANIKSDSEIWINLHTFNYFFSYLFHGRQQNGENTFFPPQTLYAKQSLEQIEDEGQIEEIEANLTNKGKDQNKLIQRIKETKQIILNFFQIDKTKQIWC